MKFLLVASGPSLFAEDVTKLATQVDRVLMVGKAWKTYPQADYLYHCDAKWWQFYKGVPEFKGEKYSLELTKFTESFDRGKLSGFYTEGRKIGLGQNSGYQAINVAYHLGAREIWLLGYDMKKSSSGVHDFDGGYPPQYIRNDSPFDIFINHFNDLSNELGKLSIPVYNYTRNSALDCFEKRSVDD